MDATTTMAAARVLRVGSLALGALVLGGCSLFDGGRTEGRSEARPPRAQAAPSASTAAVVPPNDRAVNSAASANPAAAGAVGTVELTATVAADDGAAASALQVPRERWQLKRGVAVHTQLQSWAERSSWTLDWQPQVSWLVAADATFEGNFEEVLKAVVESLFFEGKPVRLVLWQGNHLAEVVSSDAR